MTIPSIKIAETNGVYIALTAGAIGTGDVVSSFASFLSGGAGATGVDAAPVAVDAGPRSMDGRGALPWVGVGNVEVQGQQSAVATNSDEVDRLEAAGTVPAKRIVDRGMRVERQADVESVEAGVHVASKKKAMGAEPSGIEKKRVDDSLGGVVSMVEVTQPVASPTPVSPGASVLPSAAQGGILIAEEPLVLADAGGTAAMGVSAGGDPALPVEMKGTDINQVGYGSASDAAGLTADSLLREEQAQRVVGQPQQTEMTEPMQSQSRPNTFLQRQAHVPPNIADKTSIPADLIPETTPVADRSLWIANQLSSSRTGLSFGCQDVDDAGRGDEPRIAIPANTSGGEEKGTPTPRQPNGTSHARVSLLQTQRLDGGLFGLSVAGFDSATERGSFGTRASLANDVSGGSTLSTSDQFAMERLQTAGATRALGDALQSQVGLGVQTESFGRVTIHTATEGNHLLAQVTLEDGRQSATLVSHVPGVEQKLAQQLGIEAAIHVATSLQSSFTDRSLGDSGRDGSQQRRESSEAKNDRRDPMSETEGSRDVTAAWRPSVDAGRLDVTV